MGAVGPGHVNVDREVCYWWPRLLSLALWTCVTSRSPHTLKRTHRKKTM